MLVGYPTGYLNISYHFYNLSEAISQTAETSSGCTKLVENIKASNIVIIPIEDDDEEVLETVEGPIDTYLDVIKNSVIVEDQLSIPDTTNLNDRDNDSEYAENMEWMGIEPTTFDYVCQCSYH
jgi:hypothetical protein